MFKNKKLLITGGTGSFGNAVLNRFLSSEIEEIRIFSRDEKKQDEMRLRYKNKKIKFYLGDVRDFSTINYALTEVDYVFHAAALKQVPSCEFFPLEAVRTNILGTENVLSAAVINNVSKVIVLSTDKAVYPINAMGLSKAMAEKLMIGRSRSLSGERTVLCATRYGNVMTSRGSVIPLFIEQILAGQPITITDPEMTRFLMSLEESVNLVLYAYEKAHQGDILVKKAPASTIMDLAIAIKSIFNASNPIKIIGTRHGEKLYESLVSREEMTCAEDQGDFLRIPSDARDMNYASFYTSGNPSISKAKDYTSQNTNRLNVDEVKNLLLSLDYIQNILAK